MAGRAAPGGFVLAAAGAKSRINGGEKAHESPIFPAPEVPLHIVRQKGGSELARKSRDADKDRRAEENTETQRPAGPALAVWRVYRRLQRPELAQQARVAEETLGRYERGEREPKPGPLRKLGRALAVPVERIGETAELLAALDRLPPSEPLAPARTALRLQTELGTLLERGALESARLRPTADESPEAEEAHAERLVIRLREIPAHFRPGWGERCAALRGAAVVTRLCAESTMTAANCGADAIGWADLACLAAHLSKGSDAARRRLLGYAQLHRANAVRVAGQIPTADRLSGEALELWEHGDPNLPLPEDRIFSLLASLRRGQRRLPEALVLLDRALELAPPGRTAGLLVVKGKTLEEMGDYAGAVQGLQRALPLLDLDPDPRTAWAAHFNLCENLFHLGRAEEARLLLPQVYEVAHRMGNGLDLLRLRWLEGRIAAFCGRWAEAAEIFREVRAGFLARKIPFDTALVSLELAMVLLEQGKTAEVKEVARPLPPLFDALGVEREALASLAVFCAAAEREAATLAQARAALERLQRAGRGA